MPTYVRYRLDTGEILSSGSGSNEESCYIQMEDVLDEHVLLDVTADDATQYVLDGEIADRPVLDIEDSIYISTGSTRTFNLPVDTEVRFNGNVVGTLSDGVLELEGLVKATYEVTLTRFPYQQKTVMVKVV